MSIQTSHCSGCGAERLDDDLPTAAEREQWERDDEAEGKAIARAAEPDAEDEL